MSSFVMFLIAIVFYEVFAGEKIGAGPASEGLVFILVYAIGFDALRVCSWYRRDRNGDRDQPPE